MVMLVYLVSVEQEREPEPEQRWRLKGALGEAVRCALAGEAVVGVDRLEPSEAHAARMLPSSSSLS